MTLDVSRYKSFFRCSCSTSSVTYSPLSDGDGLDVHKFADAVGGEFTSVAGVLDSAEGDAGVGSDHLVDEHHAGLEFVDEAFTLAVVGGPGARAEAEAAVVGEPDGFVDVLDAEEHRDRAEKFFAVGRRFFWDVGQH